MRICIALLCLAAWAAPAKADFDEQMSRQSAEASSNVALHTRDYHGLNLFADRYRVSGGQTPSGAPLLAFYYRGIVQYAQTVANAPDGTPDDAKWQDVIAEIREWSKKAPSPASYIALARLYAEWGWEQRGSSLAKDVSPAQWTAFREKLHMAHQILDTYKDTASVDPEWYRTMILVSRGEQWDAAAQSALYHEALTRFPDYVENYYEIAESQQPKWYGSWEQFDALARLAASNTARTQGSSRYAMVYWKIGPDCDCSDSSNVAAHWPALKASFDDLVHRYPTQWNVSGFAYFACRARDRATARAQLAKLREYDPEAWDFLSDFHGQCVHWASGKS
jgi:hypothetical protein